MRDLVNLRMERLVYVGGIALLCGAMVGCGDLSAKPKKSPNSIIGKTTQKIGEFDEKADKEKVSDSKVRITSPVLPAMQAYGPALEQISKTVIKQAIDLFHATNGRYPKDYDEFMSEIIKKNNIKLPVLPAGAEYKYNVEEHKLEVVTK
ncbi:hypothetical protein Pan216_37390 [Planctomycetes bacterium Pan216]|uniref:Lipoprotein n=1 Tax=Kolteria novifilia TaxID=2527975 RepID=A0A518B7B9_9BACT|nr:hypothetical protein Pan216_37390 [Planctomycetes bacterium Pan216]